MEKILKLLGAYGCRLQFHVNHYDHAFYNQRSGQVAIPFESKQPLRFTSKTAEWEVKAMFNSLAAGDGKGLQIKTVFKLASGNARGVNLGIDFMFDHWARCNYVLLPGAAYNGNRFESRRIFYSPKLLDPRDIGPEKPMIISDVPRLNIHDGPSRIQERSGSMSMPAAGFYSPGQQYTCWILGQQEEGHGDLGFSVEENRARDQAIFSIENPVVRERTKYHITDNQYPSDDQGLNLEAGDEVHLTCRLYFFPSTRLQELFSRRLATRIKMENDTSSPASLPFSATFPVQEQKFNKQNWVPEQGYYAVGMRENFLQDWQIGWTGGMISTYPLLAQGQEETRERVKKNFDWLFPAGIAPSGFFYDAATSDDKQTCWYGGDIRKPHAKNWHLTRKSGDALFYIIKQFRVMEAMGGTPKEAWTEGIQQVANAFVQVWGKWGQFGQFIDSHSGDVVVGGSTSGAIVPAALVEAAKYFENEKYGKVAIASGQSYYDQYISAGITCGGVGDALQNPDSESAYAMLQSFISLHGYTGHKQWLVYAEEMAEQFSTWVMAYNYKFPPESLLGKLGVKTTGAVIANTQNKHGSPGICTHSGLALLQLFRLTGKSFYLGLLKNIARHIPQLLSHPDRPIEGLQEGWISERVSTTDWFEGIGEIMYGSTWSETSLMLTYTEIPGIYINPTKKITECIDIFVIKRKEINGQHGWVEIENPTGHECQVKILVDHPGKKMDEILLFNAPVVEIAPRSQLVFSF